MSQALSANEDQESTRQFQHAVGYALSHRNGLDVGLIHIELCCSDTAARSVPLLGVQLRDEWLWNFDGAHNAIMLLTQGGLPDLVAEAEDARQDLSTLALEARSCHPPHFSLVIATADDNAEWLIERAQTGFAPVIDSCFDGQLSNSCQTLQLRFDE